MKSLFLRARPAIGLLAGGVAAATLIEDFEGSTAGSGTPQAEWRLVTVAGAPSYATTRAELLAWRARSARRTSRQEKTRFWEAGTIG